MLTDNTNGDIKSHNHIILHVDGGSRPVNPGGTAISAWVMYNPDKSKILAEQGLVVKDGGELATNNYAEYCALGFALKFLDEQNWRGNIQVYSDSKLLIHQVAGTWKCKATHLQKLRKRVFELLDKLNLNRVLDGNPNQDPVYGNNCIMSWIPREQNAYADELCGKAFEEYQKTKQ